jgi:hypothetical protein
MAPNNVQHVTAPMVTTNAMLASAATCNRSEDSTTVYVVTALKATTHPLPFTHWKAAACKKVIGLPTLRASPAGAAAQAIFQAK